MMLSYSGIFSADKQTSGHDLKTNEIECIGVGVAIFA
jgi:hypothetical protein